MHKFCPGFQYSAEEEEEGEGIGGLSAQWLLIPSARILPALLYSSITFHVSSLATCHHSESAQSTCAISSAIKEMLSRRTRVPHRVRLAGVQQVDVDVVHAQLRQLPL